MAPARASREAISARGQAALPAAAGSYRSRSDHLSRTHSMSDISPRPNRTPRRTREERAYKLVVAGGAAAVIAVVTFVLAIIGIMGLTIPLLAAIVAVLCGWLFRRTVS
jgi:hypothetical protein